MGLVFIALPILVPFSTQIIDFSFLLGLVLRAVGTFFSILLLTIVIASVTYNLATQGSASLGWGDLSPTLHDVFVETMALIKGLFAFDIVIALAVFIAMSQMFISDGTRLWPDLATTFGMFATAGLGLLSLFVLYRVFMHFIDGWWEGRLLSLGVLVLLLWTFSHLQPQFSFADFKKIIYLDKFCEQISDGDVNRQKYCLEQIHYQ